MRIHKISEETSHLEGLIKEVIHKEFPDLEFYLDNTDIIHIDVDIRSLVEFIQVRLEFAKNNPERYGLEHKDWDDDWKDFGVVEESPLDENI